MKRIMCFCFIACIMLSLAGCQGRQPELVDSDIQDVSVVEQNNEDVPSTTDNHGGESETNAPVTEDNDYDFHEHEESVFMHERVELFKDFISDSYKPDKAQTDELGFEYVDVPLNEFGGVMRVTIIYGEACNYDFQFDASNITNNLPQLELYMHQLIEVINTNEFTEEGKRELAEVIDKAIQNPGTLIYATKATGGNPPLISIQAETDYLYMFLAG